MHGRLSVWMGRKCIRNYKTEVYKLEVVKAMEELVLDCFVGFLLIDFLWK